MLRSDWVGVTHTLSHSHPPQSGRHDDDEVSVFYHVAGFHAPCPPGPPWLRDRQVPYRRMDLGLNLPSPLLWFLWAPSRNNKDVDHHYEYDTQNSKLNTTPTRYYTSPFYQTKFTKRASQHVTWPGSKVSGITPGVPCTGGEINGVPSGQWHVTTLDTKLLFWPVTWHVTALTQSSPYRTSWNEEGRKTNSPLAK